MESEHQMDIIVGSTSTHKLEAVRQACEKLGLAVNVIGIKTQSGQNEQPVGFNETFDGAMQRAISAQAQTSAPIAIGIESGIFRFGNSTRITLDLAVIVILIEGGRKIVTSSEGIQFPENYVDIAEQRGFRTTTVGSIITEHFGGDPTDPHAALTSGNVTRTGTLVNPLVAALGQI